MPREELKSRLGVNPKLFAGVIDRWLATETLEERGPALAPPDHAVTLSPQQQSEADGFLAILRANPYAPPLEVMPHRELLAYLSESGAVVTVSDSVVFESAAYQRMADGIVAHLRQHETITLAQVRDLYNTSRRYAQALLEHMDERHITRRVGDERVLRSPG